MKKNIQVLQKQVVQNITPLNKRKYIKKSVEAITETKPEIIVSNEIIENENENNVQRAMRVQELASLVVHNEYNKNYFQDMIKIFNALDFYLKY